MPQNITDADTWTDPVQVAADGDPVDGASQVLIGQDLSDRARYLYNRVVPAAQRNFSVPIIGAWQSPETAPANFRFQYQAATNTMQQSSVASAGLLVVYLPQILNVTLEEVHVMCHGDLSGVGPHPNLPSVGGSMPVINLRESDYTGGGYSLLGTQIDPSASVGAYESHHVISITGMSATTFHNKQHILTIAGESGPNALNNAFHVYGAYVRFSPN